MFEPPPGFRSVDTTSLKSSGGHSILEKTQLMGKQIWYITAPAGVPVTKIQEVALDSIVKHEAILNHDGLSYGLIEDQEMIRHNVALLPGEQGYSVLKPSIDKSFRLQQIVELPNLTKNATNQNTGSDAAASYSIPAAKKPRPQPKGLKMRYKPSGFGEGDLGISGSSDEEEDEDGENTADTELVQEAVTSVADSKRTTQAPSHIHTVQNVPKPPISVQSTKEAPKLDKGATREEKQKRKKEKPVSGKGVDTTSTLSHPIEDKPTWRTPILPPSKTKAVPTDNMASPRKEEEKKKSKVEGKQLAQSIGETKILPPSLRQASTVINSSSPPKETTNGKNKQADSRSVEAFRQTPIPLPSAKRVSDIKTPSPSHQKQTAKHGNSESAPSQSIRQTPILTPSMKAALAAKSTSSSQPSADKDKGAKAKSNNNDASMSPGKKRKTEKEDPSSEVRKKKRKETA
jgi:hypothetical protein